MNYHENKKDGNIDSGNRGDFKERCYSFKP